MNNAPLCVDANRVIRLVPDPGDQRVRSAWERWDADRRLARAVQDEVPWVRLLDATA
jgi:hypothetical protein